MGNTITNNILSCTGVSSSNSRTFYPIYLRKNFDIFIDLFNAKPLSTNECELYVQIEHDFINNYSDILSPLEEYSAGQEVRNALASPDNFNLQKAAFDLVSERVKVLEKVYDFTAKVSLSLYTILNALTDNQHGLYDKDQTIKLNIETHQSLVKQLAEILNFTLNFDEKKMSNTSLQHDLSFYRRQLTKFKHFSNQTCKSETFLNTFLNDATIKKFIPNVKEYKNDSTDNVVDEKFEDKKEDLNLTSYESDLMSDSSSEYDLKPNLTDSFIPMGKVTKMSFFFGESTPMMKYLCNELFRYINENKLDYNRIIQVFAILSAACNLMLTKRNYNEKIKFAMHSNLEDNFDVASKATVTLSRVPKYDCNYYYVLRVLTGCLILYDHISTNGAFHKNSDIDVKKSIRSIKIFASIPDQRETLLNTLRFNSVHLHDSFVSKEVRQLLAVK